MLTHIDWYACGCLLLIFRESALVKHSFYEKLSDNDLLLTNANALLSVQYRYHALSLVSVIWETRTSFAEWYMKGSPKHYGRWKKKHIIYLSFFQFYWYIQSELQENIHHSEV